MVEWKPTEIVALVGVIGLTLVGLAWAAAWYAVRTAPPSPDPGVQAGRALGAALSSTFTSPGDVEQVVRVLRAGPPDQRAVLVGLLTGVLSGGPAGRLVLSEVCGGMQPRATEVSPDAEPGAAVDRGRR